MPAGCRDTFAQIILGIYKYHLEISSLITSGQISEVIYSEQQLTLQIILPTAPGFPVGDGGRARLGEVSGTSQLTWSTRGLSPTPVPVGSPFLPKGSLAHTIQGFEFCFPQEFHKNLAIPKQPQTSNPEAAPAQGMQNPFPASLSRRARAVEEAIHQGQNYLLFQHHGISEVRKALQRAPSTIITPALPRPLSPQAPSQGIISIGSMIADQLLYYILYYIMLIKKLSNPSSQSNPVLT